MRIFTERLLMELLIIIIIIVALLIIHETFDKNPRDV